MKKLHKYYIKIIKIWPVLILLLAWFIFAFPYFIQNKVPYPAAYQNSFFSPWRDYPEYAVPVKNNALSDVIIQIYPWKHFTIEELKKGTIPWWNPYSFSGNPHVADIQTAVFTPFNILFFIIPFIDAWSMLILLQPLLAGLFMYLFLKDLKISKEGSLIGSITFMFCGFIVAWMPYGTLSMAIAFLPLALYAVNRSFEKTNYKILSLIPISIAVSFFSGHFQTSIYFTAYLIVFIIIKLLTSKNIKVFQNIFIFFILGILISLLQIIPSLELYNQSVRSGLFSHEGAIPFGYLITSIAPDYYGNPVTRNDWVGHYAEWAGYIGIIPFLLACLSMFYSKERKKILFFFIAGLTALILSLDTPLQNILTNLKIPVFSTSIPSRIIVLFSFSFAVLAAFGLDKIKNSSDKKNFKINLIICLVLMTFIITIWLNLFFIKPFPQDKIIIAAKNFIAPSFSLALITGLVVLNYYFKRPVFLKIILFLSVLLTLINSLYFAKKWVPFDPKVSIFPDLPVIKSMQENIGEGRNYGKLGSFVDVYYRLPSVEGYDPLYIGRYGEFIASADTGNPTPAIKSLAVLERNAKYAERVIDLLGVTTLFHVIGDTNKEWAYPVWEKKYYSKYSIIFSDDKFQLYKNKAALPRAKLFYNYEIIKNNKEIIKRFYSENFDFRNKLILEQDPGISANSSEVSGDAKILTYSPNKIIIKTNTGIPALLFISDNYYPKWSVKVNNKEADILRSDYTFRAVVVPSGESIVEFFYDPWKAI